MQFPARKSILDERPGTPTSHREGNRERERENERERERYLVHDLVLWRTSAVLQEVYQDGANINGGTKLARAETGLGRIGERVSIRMASCGPKLLV